MFSRIIKDLGSTTRKVILLQQIRSNSVTEINLNGQIDGQTIGTLEAIALAEALKVNNSITKIDIQCTNIGTNGIIALAGALKVSNSVTTVNLANNDITDEGAKALAEALEINKSVIEIHLFSNKIGTVGATAFAKTLCVNKTINFLDISNSQVDKAAATVTMAFAESLKINKTLTKLYIDIRCTIAENFRVPALVEALQINETLTEFIGWGLSVSDNHIINRFLEANKIISDGNGCLDSNPRQAIEYYRQALQKAPEKLNIYIKIAECHIRLNRYEDALHYADELLKLMPTDQVARDVKVEILLHLSDECKSHALHDDAVRHLEQALLVPGIGNDRKLAIRAKISESLKAQGKYQEALSYLRQGSNEYKRAVKEIAEIYRDAGQVQEAIGYYEQASRLSPGDQSIRNEIAKLLSRSGNEEQALSYLRPDDSDEYINLLIRVGNARYQNQEINKALEYYEQALRLRPNLNEVKVLENTAICYHALQKYTQSLIYCNKAISMHSQDSVVQNTKFDVLIKLADSVNTVKAIEYLIEALAIKPRDREVIIKVARLFTEQGEFDKALEYFDRALSTEPNNEAIKHEIGKIYLRQGNYEQARNYLINSSEEYSTACRRIADDLIRAANEEYRQGNYQEALDNYERSLEHMGDKGKGEIYKNMADCCYRLELYEEAIDYAKQAYNDMKWKLAAKEIIVKALVGRAEHASADSAEADLREALNLKINDDNIKNELGKVLAFQGRHTEALKYFTDNSLSLRSILKIAKEHARKEDKESQDNALKYYLKALRIGTDESVDEEDIRNKVGELYFKAGKYKEAVKYLSENNDLRKEAQDILNSRDEEFRINNLRIKVKESIDNGRKSEAVDLLKQIIEIKASRDDILELCNIWKDIGSYDRALEYLEVYGNRIERDKLIEQKSSLHNAKGLQYFEAGDIINAIESFEQALVVNPNNSEIMNNLAWALSGTEDTNNFDRAIGYFRAISCKVGESIANNRLGEVYLNAERYAEAIKYFENAIELHEDDLYQNNLGYAYLKYGRLQEAIKYFEQIKRIGTKQYDRTIEYKEITLSELLREAEAVCERSGNNIGDLETVTGYYDRLVELCKANRVNKEDYRLKEALYLGKEAKFFMEKLTDDDKADVLARQAIRIDPDCEDAQYVIAALKEEAELAGNSDDSFEL